MLWEIHYRIGFGCYESLSDWILMLWEIHYRIGFWCYESLSDWILMLWEIHHILVFEFYHLPSIFTVGQNGRRILSTFLFQDFLFGWQSSSVHSYSLATSSLLRWSILTAGVPPPYDGCLFVYNHPPSIFTLYASPVYSYGGYARGAKRERVKARSKAQCCSEWTTVYLYSLRFAGPFLRRLCSGGVLDFIGWAEIGDITTNDSHYGLIVWFIQIMDSFVSEILNHSFQRFLIIR